MSRLCSTYVSTALKFFFENAWSVFPLCSTYNSANVPSCFFSAQELCFDCAQIMLWFSFFYVSTVLDLCFHCARPIFWLVPISTFPLCCTLCYGSDRPISDCTGFMFRFLDHNLAVTTVLDNCFGSTHVSTAFDLLFGFLKKNGVRLECFWHVLIFLTKNKYILAVLAIFFFTMIELWSTIFGQWLIIVQS